MIRPDHIGRLSIVCRKITRLTLPILEDQRTGISEEEVNANLAVLKKIESIRGVVSLYQRATGVNPLYLGFPFSMLRKLYEQQWLM